jgi:hypothetical protein
MFWRWHHISIRAAPPRRLDILQSWLPIPEIAEVKNLEFHDHSFTHSAVSLHQMPLKWFFLWGSRWLINSTRTCPRFLLFVLLFIRHFLFIHGFDSIGV